MGNMSYCRFHNTVIDLQDCKDVLEMGEGITTLDEHGDRLSHSEMYNAIYLIEMAREIAEQFEDIDLGELQDQWEQLEKED